MSKYMVTGAVVQVPGAQADGSKALVYAYRGAVVDLDKATADHLTEVGLVAPFGDVKDDPTVAAGSSTPPAAVRLVPADDADGEEWVAFAVRNGLTEDDARKASTEDLRAIFAGDGLTPAVEEPAKESAPRKATPARKA